MKREIYLDNSATTPLSDAACAKINEAMKIYGNPSSLHSMGQSAEKVIREARENKRISLGMLGSNYSQRKVPVELTYASLLAELASADAPRIAGWYGVVIESAEYPEITVTTERGGYIELSSKRAISARLNGAALKIDVVRPDVYRIVLHEGGRITLG